MKRAVKVVSPVEQTWFKLIELRRAHGRGALDLIECFEGEGREAKVWAMMLAVAEATGGLDGDLAVLKALVRPYAAERVVNAYAGDAAGLLTLTNAAGQWVFCEGMSDGSVNETDVARVLTAEVQAALPMAINLAWLCGGEDAGTWFQTDTAEEVRGVLDECATAVLEWDPDLGLLLCSEYAPMDGVIARFCEEHSGLATELLWRFRNSGTTDSASFDRDFIDVLPVRDLVACVPDGRQDSLWAFLTHVLRMMSEGHRPAVSADEDEAEAESVDEDELADDLGDGADDAAAPPA